MPTVPILGKPYRQLNRYRQIASVAAKIQHPGIASVIEVDPEIMHHVARLKEE